MRDNASPEQQILVTSMDIHQDATFSSAVIKARKNKIL